MTIDLQKTAPLQLWSDTPGTFVEKSSALPSWLEWECRLRSWENSYSWDNHHFFSDHPLSPDGIEQYTRYNGQILTARFGSSLATAELPLAELREKNPEVGLFLIEFQGQDGAQIRAILAPPEFVAHAKQALGFDQSHLEWEINLSTGDAFDPWSVVFDSGRWTIGGLERAEAVFHKLFSERQK